MLSGDYSSLPGIVNVSLGWHSSARWLWVALPPTMISNGRVMQKRCARKNESALSAWHRSQFMSLAHQCSRLKSKISGARREKNVLALIIVAHAPDVYCFVSELTFVRSLIVCCTFNFCFSTPDFAHSRGPLFGLSHTRAANLINNETWALYRK